MPRSKYSAGFKGVRFNRTVAISFSYLVRTKDEVRCYWLFRCDCGIEHVSDIRSAVRGMVQSCGCLAREKLEMRTKHGHSPSSGRTPEANSWKKMKARCYDPRNEWYHRYGGRGIQVCESLRNNFSAFLDLLGPRPKGKTLDRINNEGHYSCGLCAECLKNQWPVNVRWATADEQNANKATTRLITFNGRSQALFLWAREFAIPSWKLRDRLEHQSVDKVFTSLG